MVVASTPWVRTSAAAIEATSQMVSGKIALVNPVYLLLNKNKCFNISDINECERSPCQYNCHNTDGSFTCSCPTGFLLNADGLTCRDLDECATGQNLCQQNCVNTEGSYTCSCEEGYTQVGDKCEGKFFFCLSVYIGWKLNKD